MSKTFFSFIILTYIQIYISPPVCEENKNFCKKCNPVTKLCERCENDVLIPDNNGGCMGKKKCKVNYNFCEKCDLNNELCQECSDSFYSDENGGCSYIDNCEISYQGNCIKCSEDFVLVGTTVKICKSLYSEIFLNCDKVNNQTGLCEKCMEGFHLNSGDKKCITTEHCGESTNGICTKCNQSYYLDKSVNKCLMKNTSWEYCQQTVDGKTCDICEDNGYFDDEGNCIGVNYCSKGDELNNCKLCKEGYYLTKHKNSCTKEPNCNFGDKDLGICTVCNKNYYIDFKDGKCKPNNEENDFKYCVKADGDECSECVLNAYLGEDKRCSTSKHCVESHKGICEYCDEGYHVGLDNLCNNIDRCIISNYYNSCDLCEIGYYFNVLIQGCVEEIDGFQNCTKTDSSGTYCDKCREDFYLTRRDNRCYSNLENNEYYKCVFSFGEHCDACKEDYYLGTIDFKCSKVEGCEISENVDRCAQCASDQYCLNISNGICLINEYIEDENLKYLYRCHHTNENGTECEECITDYRLNYKGLCVYDGYCEVFDEDRNCTKCIQDKVEEHTYFCFNNDFECTVTYKIGCELCNNVTDFDICDKCREGYILHNGECIVEN